MEDWLRGKMNETIRTYWDMECEIPIKINSRLKKTLGMYVYEKNKGTIIPRCIHLSKEMMEHADKNIIEHILKHEICHYILSLKNKPFLDGQREFEKELKRIGAPSSKNISIEYQILCQCCDRIYRCKTNFQAKQFIKKEKTKCCSCSYKYEGVKYKTIVE